MMRDPFYKQIVQHLKNPLDPELFEQCAADILRQDFPTLVPIRGGSDAGMDGAVADGIGVAFPLICTTSDDVIGNLTKNLNSYIENAGQRRKAILATSQKLTARRRKNLERRADKLGFVLIQIYDQSAMADRLYYNERWCRELLNLTGEPSPLSIVPHTTRPLLNIPLVGRDKDIEWLRDTAGDRLLVGQPGSGKTFLLHTLAKEGRALFVVRKDISALAPAIRTQKPKALVVDDAHLDLEFLVELTHLREEVGATFEIIATCWPGARDKVTVVLNLASPKIHPLDLLTRDEIVEVIKSAGIHGPVELVREIVNQALGKPGLAATLVYLCLNGDVQKVALGDALSRSIRSTFEPLVGKEASTILAAFAIGGNSGMSLDVIAATLESTKSKVYSIVADLASGGVITEIPRLNTLSVTPAALRFALVRDVFYTGPKSLDASKLIENSSSLQDVIITLIGAKARGAIIPPGLILDLLERSKSTAAWEAFSWSGKEEANIALSRHPELLLKQIAQGALHNTPETVIPFLLKNAKGDERAVHSNPDHPLRKISDWVQSGRPGTGEAFRRRHILSNVITDALLKSEDDNTALRALPLVFSLKYEAHTTDPGRGMTVTLTHGVITTEEARQIGELWDKLFPIIRKSKDTDWNILLEVIREFAFPGPFMGNADQGFHQTTKEFAVKVIKDMVSIPAIGNGIQLNLKKIVKRLDLNITMSLDQEFETLYPIEDIMNWKVSQEREAMAVAKLADNWATVSCVTIVRKIASYESEARSAGITHPRWTPYLCDLLSKKIAERIPWVRAMIDEKLDPWLIEPFLRAAVVNNEAGWEVLITECLENEVVRRAAVTILLSVSDPPPHLLNKAFESMEGMGAYIQTLCLRRQIPETTLTRLLQHPEHLISSNAAISEWLAEPRGEVRKAVYNEWRTAILRDEEDEYWLGQILSNRSLKKWPAV